MKFEGKTIFVTGGAGFIGSHLCDKLIEHRVEQIVVYDNFSRGKVKRKSETIKTIRGDVLDLGMLRKHMRGCDVVFHLAALCGIGTVIQRPVETIEVALLGTYNVMEAARELGVNHVIVISTSEVYGQLAFKVGEETSTTQGPISEIRWGYAASKLATEYFALAYHKQYGINVTTVRPFNIYGPGQLGEGAVHHFIKNAVHDEPLDVYGDGNQIRSWCYIDDFIDGLLSIPFNSKTIGKTFNMGNPLETITVYRLAELIKRLAESRSQIRYADRETQVMDVYIRVPDITRAKKVLGFNPKITLKEGLERTIEWYRKFR